MKYEKIKIPKSDDSGYWKYRLTEDCYFRPPFRIQHGLLCGYVPLVVAEWYSLSGHWVTVREGYAWDGMTCFPDLKRWLPYSLKHDVLCQAIHDDKVLPKHFIDSAHEVFEDVGLDGHIITMGLKLLHNPWRKYNARRRG
jgi:hypothetical protein